MSRFTRRDATGIWVKEPDDYATYYPYHDGSYEAIEKLAHYEDLEEQGRLIEQKHGRWEFPLSKFEGKCSVCGEEFYPFDTGYYYCPNCGAKMDEVE